MGRFVVLLRAVNVGGRSLEMARLRAAAQANGFPDCATYIQSGNLILSSDDTPAQVGAAVEALIHAEFGMNVAAIARSADALSKLAEDNPLPDSAAKFLHLCLAKQAVPAAAAHALEARATMGERIAVAHGALWIDFAGGVGRSKLTPAAIDQAAGATVTARNWNTVRKLIELAEG